MVRQGINQTSFEKGQYSAEFAGKYDSEEYRLGCDTITNGLVTPEGAIIKAPGCKLTRSGDDNLAKDVSFSVSSISSAIITFNPSSETIIIEDPDSGRQTINSSGITVTTFDTVQVRDSLIIVDRSFFPKELKRASNGTWSIADLEIKDGPWEELNLDNKLKIRPTAGFSSTPDGLSGNGSIKAVDKADNPKSWFPDEWRTQQRKIRLRQTNSGEVTEANIQIIDTTSPPYSVNAEFVVSVDAEYPLLADGLGSHSKNWRLSAWYANNYPEKVAVHQDRLWFFRDQWRWATVSGDFSAMSPTLPNNDNSDWIATDDAAVAMQGIETVASTPQWAVSHRVLHLGTDRGTNVIQGGNFFDNITPANATFLEQNKVGASSIKPEIGTFLYYVDASNTKVYRLEYQWANQGFVPSYINRNNREIFSTINASITDFVIISDPWKMMWLSLSDGSIVVGTADENEQEWAWTKIVYTNKYISSLVKGKEETLDGVRDVFYFRIRYNGAFGISGTSELYRIGTIGFTEGVVRSYPLGNGTFTVEDIEEYNLFNTTEYSGGTPIDLNTIGSGNVVLDKQTYKVWNYSDVTKVVTPDNDYEVGEPFYIYIKFNLVDIVQSQVSSLKDNKNLTRVFFNLKKTADFKVRDTFREDGKWTNVTFRRTSDPLDEPPALFTGIKELDSLRNDGKRFCQLELTQDMPVPFQINSISYDVDINENQ